MKDPAQVLVRDPQADRVKDTTVLMEATALGSAEDQVKVQVQVEGLVKVRGLVKDTVEVQAR